MLKPAPLAPTTANFTPVRTGNRSLYFAPSGCYPTKDGKYVVITTPAEKFFGKLCRALDVDWDSQDRFKSIDARLANEDELDAVLSARTREFNREELVKMLIAADVRQRLSTKWKTWLKTSRYCTTK